MKSVSVFTGALIEAQAYCEKCNKFLGKEELKKHLNC